jgi:hypothetical protein
MQNNSANPILTINRPDPTAGKKLVTWPRSMALVLAKFRMTIIDMMIRIN